MWSLRAYLKTKCADPKFHDAYRGQCPICPLTVLLISTIRERGLSNEFVARGAGVKIERLDLLESADQCSFEDVKKIHHFLGLSVSCKCRKGDK